MNRPKKQLDTNVNIKLNRDCVVGIPICLLIPSRKGHHVEALKVAADFSLKILGNATLHNGYDTLPISNTQCNSYDYNPSQ
jgi:hypothetical protein